MIRCVVFDFDGTLVLSNKIKRDGFWGAVSGISCGNATMQKILADSPGDRYAIFDRFAAETGSSAVDLVELYSSWCEEQIMVCPERQGARELIATLKHQDIRVYLNSATPVESLRRIVARRFGAYFFDGVYGGYGIKVQNLSSIMMLEAARPDEVVMVGDGVDDLAAAQAIGCYFVGIPDGTLTCDGSYKGLLVSDLRDCWTLMSGDLDA